MPEEVKDSNIMLTKNYNRHPFNVWSKYNFINETASFDMNIMFTAFLLEAKYFYIPWK